MFSLVLPLRAVITQCLCLMVAIAVEAVILRWELKMTYRKSIEYAASINLLCTLVGWGIFFLFESTLPERTKIDLLNFIFFDRWTSSTNALIILAGIITFGFSFLIKLNGLEFLQLLLEEKKETPSHAIKVVNETDEDMRTRIASRRRKVYRSLSPETNAVLIANSSSYVAISLILLIRWLFYFYFAA